MMPITRELALSSTTITPVGDSMNLSATIAHSLIEIAGDGLLDHNGAV